MAIEVHGANGYSNDYPVERYLRNCKAAIIYEGTRDIHTLMQADWALGLKKEKAARKTLPPWDRKISERYNKEMGNRGKGERGRRKRSFFAFSPFYLFPSPLVITSGLRKYD